VIHAGLAGVTKTPEFALDKEEAKELGQAVASVNAYYGKVLDPKTVAWVGLVMVAGKIYGPRIGAWKLRTDMEKASNPPKQSRPAQPRNVASMPMSGQPTMQPPAPARIDPSFNPLS